MGAEAHPYRVAAARRAERDLNRLPEAVAAACIAFINSQVAVNPRRVGKPLRGPFEGCYVARRGSYRIIFAIAEEDRVVEILRIDHRADVYRS